MKNILLLVFTLIFTSFAHAQLTYGGAPLSQSLSEYGSAKSTDENSTVHAMYGVIFPGSTGQSGILASKLQPGLQSQATGRLGPAMYKSASGALIPMLELVTMNTSTNLPVPLVLPSSALAKIAVVTCSAGAGGAVSQALTCTGLATTDTVLAVTQKTVGANGLSLVGFSTLAANSITAIWHADPGAGSVVQVTVLHQ